MEDATFYLYSTPDIYGQDAIVHQSRGITLHPLPISLAVEALNAEPPNETHGMQRRGFHQSAASRSTLQQDGPGY